jgi:hypothetical protein
MPLGGEPEQLGAAVLTQRLDRLAAEQARVARVDRLDFELVLDPGEVEVVLAVEVRQERLRLAAIVVGAHGLPA